MNRARPLCVPDGELAYRFIWDTLGPEHPATSDRPVFRAVMVASVNGSVSVEGRSAPLGTPTDQLVFFGMRARADLIVVGASTALAEDYGPVVIDKQWQELRGDRPTPPILLCANTLHDSILKHFERRGVDGFSVAISNDSENTPAMARANDIGLKVYRLERGQLGTSLRDLAARLGAHEVNIEGGARLLGALVSQDGVDELVITTAPQILVDDHPAGIVRGTAGTRTNVKIAASFTCPEGGLYSRWVREGDAQ